MRNSRLHQRQLAEQLLQDADAFDRSIHARPSLSPDQWRLISCWLLAGLMANSKYCPLANSQYYSRRLDQTVPEQGTVCTGPE